MDVPRLFDWVNEHGDGLQALAALVGVPFAIAAGILAWLAYRSQKQINDRAVRQVEERFASLVAWWFIDRPVADKNSVARRLYEIPNDDDWHLMETIKVQNRSAVPIRNVKYALLPANVKAPMWWRLPDIPPFVVVEFPIRLYGNMIHEVLFEPGEDARALFFEDPVGRWRWDLDGLKKATDAEWAALTSFPEVQVQILLTEGKTEKV